PAPFGVRHEDVHALPSGGPSLIASLGFAAAAGPGEPGASARGVGAGEAAAGRLFVRSRKAKSTPSAVRRAAKMLHSDERGTPRLGTFGWDGSPYVSGLSTSR